MIDAYLMVHGRWHDAWKGDHKIYSYLDESIGWRDITSARAAGVGLLEEGALHATLRDGLTG